MMVYLIRVWVSVSLVGNTTCEWTFFLIFCHKNNAAVVISLHICFSVGFHSYTWNCFVSFNRLGQISFLKYYQFTFLCIVAERAYCLNLQSSLGIFSLLNLNLMCKKISSCFDLYFRKLSEVKCLFIFSLSFYISANCLYTRHHLKKNWVGLLIFVLYCENIVCTENVDSFSYVQQGFLL